MNTDIQDIVILTALEQELPRAVAAPYEVVYTGVGKINAAMTAMKAIQEHRPRLVINFGTAGALTPGITGLVEVSTLHERDMDARALGFALGQTPFEEEYVLKTAAQIGISCGSGDQFVNSTPELKTDIVDMEAFAIAKVCARENVSFRAWKYISDNADGQAHLSWEENIAKGSRLFMDMLSVSPYVAGAPHDDKKA